MHRPSPIHGHWDPFGANQSNDIMLYFIFNFYFDFLMLHNTMFHFVFHLFLYFCLLLLLFYLLKVRGNFCGLFISFSSVGRLKLTKFGTSKQAEGKEGFSESLGRKRKGCVVNHALWWVINCFSITFHS